MWRDERNREEAFSETTSDWESQERDWQDILSYGERITSQKEIPVDDVERILDEYRSEE